MKDIDSALKLAITELGTSIDMLVQAYPKSTKEMKSLLKYHLDSATRTFQQWLIAAPIHAAAEKHKISNKEQLERAIKESPAVQKSLGNFVGDMMDIKGISLEDIFAFANKKKAEKQLSSDPVGDEGIEGPPGPDDAS